MSAPVASIPRRHDLDALRAIAMLLGIALHGALSFVPMPEGAWAVLDERASEGYNLFMAVIHGFRMPLFFLISGFFTAMLWRKRGLLALIQHRCKRILLPLFIGMFTIVPAVWIVSIGAGIATSGGSAETAPSIHRAAAYGKNDEVTALLDSGADPYEPSPASGQTPLALAVWYGQTDTVSLLLDHGVDPNVRSRNGATALHGAALFGRAAEAELLIDHGADQTMIDKNGNSISDSLKTDLAQTTILTSIFKVSLVEDQIVEGRKKIFSMMHADPQAGDSVVAMPPEIGNPARLSEDPLGGLIMLATWFPVFHHLWFLWFLCWLVAAFAIYAWIADRVKFRLPKSLVASPLCYLWLIPLTIVPQSMMGLIYPNFGPDTSAGLLPMWHILLYYMIFFFFGALYFDSDDHEGKLGKWWRVTVPFSLLVIFPIGYELTHGGFGFGYAILDQQYHRPVAVVLQVAYVWLMSFGLMGLFRGLMSTESKAMRYISDSSYWLYLAHLPWIIVAQAMVKYWQVPSLVKFTLICVVCSALLLLSYQWFVRYTPIGTLLNGPRKRPGPAVNAVLVEPSAASAG